MVATGPSLEPPAPLQLGRVPPLKKAEPRVRQDISPEPDDTLPSARWDQRACGAAQGLRWRDRSILCSRPSSAHQQGFIGIADTHRRSDFLNAAGRKTVGLQPDDGIPATPISAFLHPADRAAIRDAALPRLVAGRPLGRQVPVPAFQRCAQDESLRARLRTLR